MQMAKSSDQDTRSIDLINKFMAREVRYHNDAKERRDLDETYFYSGRVGILEEVVQYLSGEWTHGPQPVENDNRVYDIWTEGFRATGQYGTAMLHKSVKAGSLKEACLKYAQEDTDFEDYFDPERMTYWGCKIFDNESDARKSFG
jgi:hypothetical protein